MTLRTDRELHGEEMVGPESRIDVQQRSEAAAHQTGADHQDHRERDLDDDEPCAQPVARGPARVPAALAQHVLHVGR